MEFQKEHTTFKIADVLKFREAGKINLNPGFQRRSVWTPKEQSLLIDTILNEMPLPNIFLWERKSGKKTVYDVIDGKQRIEAILAFTRKKMPLPIKLRKDWSHDLREGQRVLWRDIAKLNTAMLRNFMKYEIPAVIVGGGLEDVEQVFLRINSTGKKLTPQEILHAKWQNSPLLHEAEKISTKYRQFFLDLSILSEGQLSRMKAVELIAEILLSFKSQDVLDKKKALDDVIGNNSIHKATLKRVCRETTSVLDYIKRYFSAIGETRFSKTSDFYALTFAIWKMKRDGYHLNDKKAAATAFELLKKLDLDLASYRQATREGNKGRLEKTAQQYYATVVEGTDSARHRRDRIKIIESLIRPVFMSKDPKRLFTFEQKQLLWHSDRDKVCGGCQELLTWKNVQIDHIVPHSKGGRTSGKNAQLLCADCNRGKSDKPGRPRNRNTVVASPAT